MIRFEHVTITYPEANAPTLVDVSFEVPEGELCLVVGVTGSGKSTLLRAVNGLVPRFSGGVLAGSVVIDGKSTADLPPRDLADVVGVVGQDPAAGFVTDYVEDELAYAMENLGLHEVRHRPLASLSGGQQQRVAIGSVLTAGPRVLVLDEPTSALDPAAAEEVLAALTRLVHDLGITVLIAEHRLERVVQYADRIVMVPGDGRSVIVGTPAEVFGQSSVAPPVVELGRLAGCHFLFRCEMPVVLRARCVSDSPKLNCLRFDEPRAWSVRLLR
jgi:energy-coupling factor transport system ATP-binding protein